MSKMVFKVTKQYAKEDEQPLSEFSDLNDAIFFIERKILSDSEKYITLIYRLFNGHKLIREFNKEKITCSIHAAKYAAGDNDLPFSIGFFKVCQDRSVVNAIASFMDLDNAELFVEDKLTQSNDETTYYIFNNNKLITQMNQHTKKQFLEEGNNQGKGQSASFRPTPLNTSPRPPGTPHAWIKDDNQEDKEK